MAANKDSDGRISFARMLDCGGKNANKQAIELADNKKANASINIFSKGKKLQILTELMLYRDIKYMGMVRMQNFEGYLCKYKAGLLFPLIWLLLLF